MFHKLFVPFAMLSLLVPLGCDDGETVEDTVERSFNAAGENIKDTQNYFEVRRDLRRCVWPLCGGYWISELNHRYTQCADGSYAQECYVAQIDLPVGVELQDGDVVHGYVATRTYDGFEQDFGAMEADFAYAPTLESNPEWGRYELVYDTGIRCITTPCPSQAIARVNRDWVRDAPSILFWGADAEEDDVLSRAFEAEYVADSDAGTGALVLGAVFRFFGQRFLFVTNVLEQKSASGPFCLVVDREQSATAWNVPTEADALAIAAAFEPEDRWELLPGRCDEQNPVCPLYLQYVSGTIDAYGDDVCVEETNPCFFRGAVIEAAGADSKATGTWSVGRCE